MSYLTVVIKTLNLVSKLSLQPAAIGSRSSVKFLSSCLKIKSSPESAPEVGVVDWTLNELSGLKAYSEYLIVQKTVFRILNCRSILIKYLGEKNTTIQNFSLIETRPC